MTKHNPRKPNLNKEELWLWFLQQLDKKDNGCWEWKNGTNKAGYGQISVDKKLIGTHCYALQHKLGRPINKNMLTRHLCNNMICCNPDHLEEGTHLENMKDRDIAGHTVKGDKHHNVKGELHPHAKLNEQQIRDIRSLKGWFTKIQLSEIYNVSPTHIYLIQTNKSWKHIN